MTTITKVQHGEQVAKLAEATKAGAKTLAGGLNVPEGKHAFLVADKDAFGILNVRSATSGNWALPIVAGIMEFADNAGKQAFTIESGPGSQNLVIPDAFFVSMQPNARYLITIEVRKGRKVVANVEVHDFEENVIPEVSVKGGSKKERKPAF